jgi:hypothetical protein
VAGLGALGLSAARLGRPERRRPGRWWAYLPPLLATASWAGVPLTLGWAGRGALYQATWAAGAPGTLALVVVAEGAALAALYRYWQRCLRPDAPLSPSPYEDRLSGGSWPGGPKWLRGVDSRAWLTMAATLACIPLLIPVLRLPSAGVPPALANPPPLLSAAAGLAGALLWAFFLGYGRRRLLAGMPWSPHTLARGLRLGWLVGGPKPAPAAPFGPGWPLGGLGHALERLGHLFLRIRTVIEGEHYLAWAILLTLALVLVILLR